MKYTKEYDKPITYEMPPEGRAMIEIVDAAEKTSKSGNEMVEIKAEVCAGQPGEGYPLYDYIVDNPDKPEQAPTKVGNVLRACGQEPDGEFEVTSKMLIGLKGEALIYYDEWNGKKRAKINYWLNPNQNTEDDIPF